MRFSYTKAVAIIMIMTSLLLLQGCKDSKNEIDETSVLGLWQLNSTEGDINYVNISTENVTFYDYMGDDYDEGPDCYVIESQDILDVNGSTYTFQDPLNSNATIKVDVKANGNELTVTQPFGDITITLKFNKSNASISSFTPACDENSLKHRKSGSFFEK